MSSKNDGTTMTILREQNQDPLSSQESQPKRTRSKSVKVLESNLSRNGLEDSKIPSTLEPENALSSKKRQESAMPVPKLSAKQDRVRQALKRLGVDPEQVESAPQITPLLKNADGGLKQVIGAMRFAPNDESIREFLAKYDSIPSGDRERLPWEAIALSVGLDMNALLGAIMFALQNHSVNTVKLIAVTSHPKVTKARVKYALLPSGEKDRFALDTAMGFLPSPKGPTFIGKAIFGGAPQTANEKDEDGTQEGVFVDDGDLDSLFPPSNAMQEKLVPIRQKLLE